jgi:hypothetical protein
MSRKNKLMRTPGATRFGNELLFIFNLPPETANAARAVDQRRGDMNCARTVP